LDCAVLAKLLLQETKEALEAATALTRRLQSTEASLAAAQVCKGLFLLFRNGFQDCFSCGLEAEMCQV